jgi:xylose isomerase
MNRGDAQSGWDTDQFPNSLAETALALYYVFRAGGFTTGGLNFDAKVRRQSIDPDDLVHAHVGAMDVCARALLIVERMIGDGALEAAIRQRYEGWELAEGRAILGGERSLADLAARVDREGLEPQPRSGRQEYLENLINRYLF